MNALQSYSSDDEYDEEPATRKMTKIADSGTNYDEVGMDISEDSDDEAAPAVEEPSKGDRLSDASLNNKHPPKNSEPAPQERDRKSHATDSSKSTDRKEYVDKNKGRRNDDAAKDHRYSSSGSSSRRSRERSSREKNSSGNSSRDYRESSSRDYKDSRRSADAKDYPRKSVSRAEDRKTSSGSRAEERKPTRKSRSPSRERKRFRTRSRSRERERRRRRTRTRSRSRSSRSKSRTRSKSRSRDRSRDRSRGRSRGRSRDRSRDRDRRRPHEIRKAQQKLAAFKASNPNFDHNEMLKRGMEAQFAEVQKNTGVTLPSYYNPATMNPLKIAEQERKKKLLWGNKSKPEASVASESAPGASSDLWVNTRFINDTNGKMAEKFKRLMGVKSTESFVGPAQDSPHSGGSSEIKEGTEILQKQESMFSSMEKQYEMARLATHTHKGFGLGFTSQTYFPKP